MLQIVARVPRRTKWHSTTKNQIYAIGLRAVTLQSLSPERRQVGRFYTLITSTHLEAFGFTCVEKVVFQGEDVGKIPPGQGS